MHAAIVIAIQALAEPSASAPDSNVLEHGNRHPSLAMDGLR
jgi:hypothetical protein